MEKVIDRSYYNGYYNCLNDLKECVSESTKKHNGKTTTDVFLIFNDVIRDVIRFIDEADSILTSYDEISEIVEQLEPTPKLSLVVDNTSKREGGK